MAALDDIFVSGKELDAELLGTALKPLLRIDEDALQIRPLRAWRTLSAKGKIGAYLLARKAMVARGLLEDDRASPTEVIQNVGLPEGTVHPTLKRMYESRPQLLQRDSESKYSVPGWAVHDVVDLISSESGGRNGQ
jgi:hypothetical protein